jgi:hypothetical protein
LIALTVACGGGSGSPTAGSGEIVPATPPPQPTAAATATYRVTFNASWSRATHPTDFPDNPHFSGLIGATHLESTRFWEVGAIASDGIKAMAERGRKAPLDQEIENAIANGRAEHLLSGGPIGRSPGSVALDFEIGVDQPFVTLVAMVAPSPDWFVGVSALSLLENGDWAQLLEIELFAYDAGTDGGSTFTSLNQPLSPRVAIFHIENGPLIQGSNGAPLGRFTFRRLS